MTILVGYAPRPESLAALNKALDIARSTGERVVVVNAGPGGEHRNANLITEAQQRELQQLLDGSGVQTEFRQYARGRSTSQEMKDVAAELDPSIVVIGLRRRGGFGRFVMGSVSDELIQDLDQPVLCVKEYTLRTPDAPSAVAATSPVPDSHDDGRSPVRDGAEPEPLEGRAGREGYQALDASGETAALEPGAGEPGAGEPGGGEPGGAGPTGSSRVPRD